MRESKDFARKENKASKQEKKQKERTNHWGSSVVFCDLLSVEFLQQFI